MTILNRMDRARIRNPKISERQIMKKTAIKVLSKQESDSLIKQLERHQTSDKSKRDAVRNSCITTLMLDAGLRVGEVVKLHIGSLMFAGEPCLAIVIPTCVAKTGVERTIPATENLKYHIRQMHLFIWGPNNYSTTDYAFFGRYSFTPLTIRRVQYIIRQAGLLSIGRIVTPHQLRHTFATRLMGVCSTRVIQHLLGHVALSSTQIYTHPNSLDMVSAIRKMETRENSTS